MLNISNWKKYKFDDIFIIKKGFYNKKPEHTKIGNIPFLGATEYNNGVTGYYSLEDIQDASKTGDDNNVAITEKIFQGKSLCVTNNGSVGFAFYQEDEFTCSHDVNPLYIKDGEFNRAIALFVATVISADRYRWAYGRKWRPERMKDSFINLPSDKNGKPDWKFMEEYIENLENAERESKSSIKDSLNSINDSNQDDKNINIDKWAEFKLGNLFDKIYKAKAYVKEELRTSKYLEKAHIPFITRTGANNGCDCYVSIEDIEDYEKGNAIIIGDTTATIFYQKEDFATGDHIVVCRADWVNEYTALFLKSVIEKDKYRYSYGRAFKMELIKETCVKLPVKNNEEIDFEYMESYIKSLPYGDRI